MKRASCSTRPVTSLAIHLWFEGTAPETGEWRFRITHVQSGREFKGVSLSALVGIAESLMEGDSHDSILPR